MDDIFKKKFAKKLMPQRASYPSSKISDSRRLLKVSTGFAERNCGQKQYQENWLAEKVGQMSFYLPKGSKEWKRDGLVYNLDRERQDKGW